MKVIEKINLFYKQANNKDEKLNYFVHYFKVASIYALDKLEFVYSNYIKSLGNNDNVKSRLKNIINNIKNAKESVSILLEKFLKTHDVNFIEQSAKIVVDAAWFSTNLALVQWYKSTTDREVFLIEASSALKKFNEKYAALKEYIYK